MFSVRSKKSSKATDKSKEALLRLAKERGPTDEWGLEVLGRLNGISDLVAAETSIHALCRTAFSNPTNPLSQKVTFNILLL
jgi:hypothetical protein